MTAWVSDPECGICELEDSLARELLAATRDYTCVKRTALFTTSPTLRHRLIRVHRDRVNALNRDLQLIVEHPHQGRCSYESEESS